MIKQLSIALFLQNTIIKSQHLPESFTRGTCLACSGGYIARYHLLKMKVIFHHHKASGVTAGSTGPVMEDAD